MKAYKIEESRPLIEWDGRRRNEIRSKAKFKKRRKKNKMKNNK